MAPTKKSTEKPAKGSSSKGKSSKDKEDNPTSSKLKAATAINARHILVRYLLPLFPVLHRSNC